MHRVGQVARAPVPDRLIRERQSRLFLVETWVAPTIRATHERQGFGPLHVAAPFPYRLVVQREFALGDVRFRLEHLDWIAQCDPSNRGISFMDAACCRAQARCGRVRGAGRCIWRGAISFSSDTTDFETSHLEEHYGKTPIRIYRERDVGLR